MEELQAIFNTFFQTLEQVSTLDGGLIINKNGEVIANFLKQDNEDGFSKLASNTVNLVTKILKEGRAGIFKNILLEGVFGKIYILALYKLSYYVLIFGSKSMNIGMIRVVFEEMSDNIPRRK